MGNLYILGALFCWVGANGDGDLHSTRRGLVGSVALPLPARLSRPQDFKRFEY
jgi:hypothetical protein